MLHGKIILLKSKKKLCNKSVMHIKKTEISNSKHAEITKQKDKRQSC